MEVHWRYEAWVTGKNEVLITWVTSMRYEGGVHKRPRQLVEVHASKPGTKSMVQRPCMRCEHTCDPADLTFWIQQVYIQPATCKKFQQSWVKKRKRLAVWPFFVVILYPKIRAISQWFCQEDLCPSGVEQSLVTAWSSHIMSQSYLCHNCWYSLIPWVLDHFPSFLLYNRYTLTYLIHIKCVITLNVWKIYRKCITLTKIWCHSISSQFSSSVLDHNIFLVEWTYSTLSDYVISINAWKYVENSLFDKICFST